MIIDITVSNICTLHIDDKQKCVRKERKKEMAFVCFVMDSLIVFMSMLDMLEQIDILLWDEVKGTIGGVCVSVIVTLSPVL